MTPPQTVRAIVLPPLAVSATLGLLLLALAGHLILQTPISLSVPDSTQAAWMNPLLTACLLGTSAVGALILSTQLGTHLITRRVTQVQPPVQVLLFLCGLTALALGPVLSTLA